MSDTTADSVPTTPAETDPNVPYYCRYLTTKGEQCRQIALNGRNFCFAHRDTNPAFGYGSVRVPVLEDHASIQLMLTKILHGLLNDHLPLNIAGKAIHCCQVAVSTLPRPVAYRPRPGEKLPAPPLPALEIYKDELGNLMGPLEEYPLPPAPAEPESARAKSRAEWNPCVAHHYWCPGPTATLKCAHCQRVAQFLSELPKEEEPSAALSPTQEPALTPPAHTAAADEPCRNAFSERSTLNPERCSDPCSLTTDPCPEPCRELAELTAAADESCCNPCSGNCAFPARCRPHAERCSSELTAAAVEARVFPERGPLNPERSRERCSVPCTLHPAPCPAVVELITSPANMIPNDIKTAPQGGPPHSQNESTQIDRSLAGGGEFRDGSLRRRG